MEPTVTLSLILFDKMRDSLNEYKKENLRLEQDKIETQQRTDFAHRQLGILLSSLAPLPEFQREVDTFNARSQESKITIQNGEVVIQIEKAKP